MHEPVWQLQEAKACFSEVVNQALEQGPQTVTRHGHAAVVVVAADEFRRTASRRRLRSFFRQRPYLDGVSVVRDRSQPREVNLCDTSSPPPPRPTG